MIVLSPQIWPAVLAAFLASLVEFVEALTVVLAVGAVRGWPSALVGSTAALIVLNPLLSQIKLARLQAEVDLFKALGGVWKQGGSG